MATVERFLVTDGVDSYAYKSQFYGATGKTSTGFVDTWIYYDPSGQSGDWTIFGLNAGYRSEFDRFHTFINVLGELWYFTEKTGGASVAYKTGSIFTSAGWYRIGIRRYNDTVDQTLYSVYVNGVKQSLTNTVLDFPPWNNSFGEMWFDNCNAMSIGCRSRWLGSSVSFDSFGKYKYRSFRVWGAVPSDADIAIIMAEENCKLKPSEMSTTPSTVDDTHLDALYTFENTTNDLGTGNGVNDAGGIDSVFGEHGLLDLTGYSFARTESDGIEYYVEDTGGTAIVELEEAERKNYIVHQNLVPLFLQWDQKNVDEWGIVPESETGINPSPDVGKWDYGVGFHEGLKNYLSNPSCEKFSGTSDVLSDWSLTGASSDLEREENGRVYGHRGKLIKDASDATATATSVVTGLTLGLGDDWTFSVFLRAANAVTGSSVKIRLREGDNSSANTELSLNIDTADDWQRFDVTHTITDAANTKLYCEIESSTVEPILFDDAQLEPFDFASAPIAEFGDQLLSNPAFELGLNDLDPEFWTFSGSGQTLKKDGGIYNGESMAVLYPATGNDSATRSIYQEIDISPTQGDIYEFSAFLRNERIGSAATVTLRAREYQSGVLVHTSERTISLERRIDNFLFYRHFHTIEIPTSDTLRVEIETTGVAFLNIDYTGLRTVTIEGSTITDQSLSYDRLDKFSGNYGTFACYFNPYRDTGVDLSRPSYLLAMGDATGAGDFFGIYFDDDQTNIGFKIIDGGSTRVDTTFTVSLTAGTNYLLFLRWSETQVEFFLDGVIVGTAVAISGDMPRFEEYDDFYIGNQPAGGEPASGIISNLFLTKYADYETEYIEELAARTSQLEILWDAIEDFTTYICHDGPQIRMDWRNTSDYEEILILRKLRGYPLDGTDGDELLQNTDQNVTVYSDITPLSGRFSYYTLFIRALGLPKDVLASDIYDYELAYETGYLLGWLYEKALSPIYRDEDAKSRQVALLEQTDSTTGEQFNIGADPGEKFGELYRFLKNFAAEFERVRAKARIVLKQVDPDECGADKLDYLAYLLNFAMSQNLTPEEKRSLIKELVTLYQLKGSLEGIQAFVKSIANYEVTVKRSSRENLGFFNYDGSDFFDFEQSTFDDMYTDADDVSYMAGIDEGDRLLDNIDIYIQVPYGEILSDSKVDEIVRLIPVFLSATATWNIYQEYV